jgi:hypothetical protein
VQVFPAECYGILDIGRHAPYLLDFGSPCSTAAFEISLQYPNLAELERKALAALTILHITINQKAGQPIGEAPANGLE